LEGVTLRVFHNFFNFIKRFSLRVLITLFILSSLHFTSGSTSVFAEGTRSFGACHTSGPASGAYIVTVCLTVPVDNAVVSGNTSVTATISVMEIPVSKSWSFTLGVNICSQIMPLPIPL
jgi:hypothetical protein